MTPDDIQPGELYFVEDRIAAKETYKWRGSTRSTGTCWRRKVKALGVHDHYVLVETCEPFFQAPPFRTSTFLDRELSPAVALEQREAVHRSLSEGARVWLPVYNLEGRWDEIAAVEEPRRTQPRRREEAIAALRDAGLDRETGDLGCIDVSVTLLVELVEELEVLRQVERDRKAAA